MPDGMLRHWIEPQPQTVPAEFQESISGHKIVSEILTRRGIKDLGSAQAFLSPDQYHPTSPIELPGVINACERIEIALSHGEKICVWGDFDVDGQTSTTLLVSALRGLCETESKHLIRYHIPVRARESHGVNWENLEPILRDGVSLVITCDTGISSSEPLLHAHQLGVDVIVSDHHDLPEELPEAHSIINPKLLDHDHPLYHLPGVGVAYKLAEALYTRAGRGDQTNSFLDLVALGIVADLAIQVADTRWLLQRGLKVLKETHRTGIEMMLELSGLQNSHLTEEHIGFVLAPRLNALGRLDDANLAVELLTTSDQGRARVIATHLEGLNARRRLLTEQVLKGALAQLEKDRSLLDQPVLILSHPEWPSGVIGIVASELAERFNRPTILLSTPPGQPARGSARSIDGVHITEAIAANKQYVLGFGGHPMAAGLSLETDRIPAFRHGLSRFVAKVLEGAAPRLTLSIDSWITLSEMNLNLVSDIERLAPFGPGNPPLVFAIPNVSIVSSNTIGRDADHVQVIINDENDNTQRVIWWRGAGWPLPEGRFDLACVVRSSNYRGQLEMQVEWIDARPVSDEEIRTKQSKSIIDQRDLNHPLPVLQQITDETPAIVWGEADAHERLPFADRTQLTTADTLIVWTTPPGHNEFESVINLVQPKTIVLFAIDPQITNVEDFLKRLTGIAKHVIIQKNGQAAISWLAAATAQREMSVRLGLQWLDHRGIIKVRERDESTMILEPGNGIISPEPDKILNQLRALLNETASYRKYFKVADKDNLL